MPRVLFITYHFPPMSAAGVHRSAKFVRYLPMHGWQPHVLTVSGTGAYASDPDLAREIPVGVTVERSFPASFSQAFAPLARLGLRELARWFEEFFRIPDRHLPWAASIVLRGLALARQGAVDAIYTTSPPESTHVAGLFLARATGLPWVADFRNEWTTHPEKQAFLTPCHRALHAALEAEVLARADQIVTLAPPHTELLRAAHPRRAADVTTIENGVDPADFAGLESTAPPADRFVVGHAGTFFGADSPRVVLEAMQGLDHAQLRTAGYLWEAETCVRAAGPLVRVEGNLPHAAALRLMRESTVLLLLLVPERSRSYPGKMYEYLAAGRPILAVVPPDAGCRAVLAESGRAVFADPRDPTAVRAALHELYARWRAGELGAGPLAAVPAERTRPALAGDLARVLDQARERRPR